MVAELRHMVEMLSDAYGVALMRVIDASPVSAIDGDHLYPLRAVDASGRFVLLDALAALTTAYAALCVAEMAEGHGHGGPAQGHSEPLGVPEGGDGGADSHTADLAGASGIVAGLMDLLEQAEPDRPPSPAMIAHHLARVMGKLRQAPARRTPPARRIPGQIHHGQVTS